MGEEEELAQGSGGQPLCLTFLIFSVDPAGVI